jgi:predicted homoserine dehydrogenase-like protein
MTFTRFFGLKIIGLFIFSFVLAGCSSNTTSVVESSDCPKVDLTQINATPDSADYFDQAAKIVEKESQSFIGLTETSVEFCALQNNLGFRVGSRDGEFFALTMDYIPTRITVDVEKNIVTKIQAG